MTIPSYLINAIAGCEQALTTEPLQQDDLKAACRTLSNILQGMGRFEESATWSSHSLDPELDPVVVYTSLGFLYANRKLWREGIAAYKRALQLQPDCLDAYWSLAQIYSHLGDKEQELECWFQSLELKPDQAIAQGHYKLGKAFVEQGQPDRAISCYQRALQADAKLYEAYEDLGDIFLAQGTWEEARSYYEQALAQDPEQAWAYYKLGVMWLRQHKFTEAADEFRKCIDLEPDYPWAYQGLVKIFVRQQQWDKVIETCRAIISMVQEYPWAYTHLGNAMMKTGERNSAIAAYQKACELSGWHQCLRKNYEFTHDWFSHRIPVLERSLHSLINVENVQGIEIGSFQGMSACWLLDRILTHPSAQLVCIDRNFQQQFDSNIAKSGFATKVTKLRGNADDLLASLEVESYHLVNFQDRFHETAYLQRCAEIAWRLLKLGGVLIFKDYSWASASNSYNCAQRGINTFLNSLKEQGRILHQANQIIVQKVVSQGTTNNY